LDQLLILIYLLTAIGLTPGGSSTVHTYTQTIHRTTQLATLVGRLSGIENQSGKRDGRALSLRVIPWHLPYNRGKSMGKPQSG
jgi:uncharacterized integral membrane protein